MFNKLVLFVGTITLVPLFHCHSFNQFHFNPEQRSRLIVPFGCIPPNCDAIQNVQVTRLENVRTIFTTRKPTFTIRSLSISPNHQKSSKLQEEKNEQCAIGTCENFHNCKSRPRKPTRFCSTDFGFTGICCEAKTSITLNNTIGITSATTPTLTGRTILVKVNEVRSVIHNLESLENELHANQIVPQRNTKEFSHQNFFGGNDVTLKEMQNAYQVLQGKILRLKTLSELPIVTSMFERRASPVFVGERRHVMRPPSIVILQAFVCISKTKISMMMIAKDYVICVCVISGNNLINTAQGKAVSTFARLLPAEYADGINEPRRAKDGSELPNPRLLSLSIAPEANLENNKYSLLLMQFGQFVDHDLTRTGTTKTHNNEQINCCDEKVVANPRLRHPACFEIPIPEQDQFLINEQQTCMNFVRSAPAVNPKCRFGPREQLNQLSSYLDGNNIYGASLKESNELREFRNGRLLVSFVNNEEFLPLRHNDTNCQLPKNSELKCFRGGDIRINEVTDLTVLHAIFLREHNRIAAELHKLHPTWKDEQLYQETKRIVVAQFQHIIYNEFVPLIVGPRALQHFSLQLSPGFSDTYDPIIDSTILNEFSTAAYRLHSLIQGTLNLNSAENRVLGTVKLRDQFNNPQLMYHPSGMELRIAVDNFFSREVTHHLFQIAGKRFGLDLVALNLQRGRDHGIPGYVKYREICGLTRVTSFNDLKRIFSNPQVADVMAQLYNDIEDIDLFIAGSSEKVLPGAVVGPTFTCIIGEQFRRIKNGDRFWYENPNQAGSFTAAQLAQIKQATISRIFCDNSNVELMQLNAFLMPSKNNLKLSCKSNDIPRVDLRAWA
ncbi:hypothetical protein BLOT_006536 [Blomia tropicalis]|nr:hypothetical protein BLOT_006536 [Blomia tropicalis]